jgi:hypothetical protein
MPEVLRALGFTVQIYYGDHEPRHVHVLKAGTEVKIDLGQLADEHAGLKWLAPTLTKVKAMSRAEVKQALRLIYEHQTELLLKWEEIANAGI